MGRRPESGLWAAMPAHIFTSRLHWRANRQLHLFAEGPQRYRANVYRCEISFSATPFSISIGASLAHPPLEVLLGRILPLCAVDVHDQVIAEANFLLYAKL